MRSGRRPVGVGCGGGGLNRFDPKTETFRATSTTPPGQPEQQRSLVHSPWLIGRDVDRHQRRPSSFLDPRAERFTVYRRKDGLSGDRINTILEDDLGQLWLGTADGGITRFDPGTGATKAYDASDGLQGNQFLNSSACKSRTGALLFGGENGFNIIDPAHIATSNT